MPRYIVQRSFAHEIESPLLGESASARLDLIEHERGLPGSRIYYLAVPPSLFVPTVEQLRRARFVAPPDARRFARLIVEKPIGRDLDRTFRQFLDKTQVVWHRRFNDIRRLVVEAFRRRLAEKRLVGLDRAAERGQRFDNVRN